MIAQVLLAIGGVVVLLFLLTVLRGAPYVPSKRRHIRQAFRELYRLTAKDLLVDIGSGDGVVLREAAACGARAVGYEINPVLVAISKFLSRKYPNISVRLADFWHVNIPPEATIIYTFGESRDIERMAGWVEKQATALGRPLYFLSYAFALRGRTPVKKSRLYTLYRIEPLQIPKP